MVLKIKKKYISALVCYCYTTVVTKHHELGGLKTTFLLSSCVPRTEFFLEAPGDNLLPCPLQLWDCLHLVVCVLLPLSSKHWADLNNPRHSPHPKILNFTTPAKSPLPYKISQVLGIRTRASWGPLFSLPQSHWVSYSTNWILNRKTNKKPTKICSYSIYQFECRYTFFTHFLNRDFYRSLCTDFNQQFKSPLLPLISSLLPSGGLPLLSICTEPGPE